MPLAPYNFRPITPPEAAGQLFDTLPYQKSSYYSSDTSPDSAITNSTMSTCSPALRQHGPTLLPKIRSQDSYLEPSSAAIARKTHRRVLSMTNNPPAHASYANTRPPMQRCATEPVECTNLTSPISNVSFFGSRASSAVPSPSLVNAVPNRKHLHSHSRSASSSSIDESVLTRFGYPTYRRMPVYVSQATGMQSSAVYAPPYPSYPSTSQFVEPPYINIEGTFQLPIDLSNMSRHSSMTPPPSLCISATNSLLDYLTQPTQPVNLVRQLTFPTGRGLNSHFWWDIRNLRSWESFSVQTMSNIPDLLSLLNFQHDSNSFSATPAITNTVTPASEADLASIITKIYFPKVNAACRLSLGSNSLSLYPAPAQDRSTSAPHFLANYANDGDRTLSGLPRGRVVGLVKSFDRWNTGMRREGPARKVEYLKGLAHLQKCMRDHSCRYGFIITEIELVCVRAGCDAKGQPYFGYLELSEAIATKTAIRSTDPENSGATPEPQEIQMTVTLALYYLLMLAKATPLPGQPSSFMDVGGPGALTRQRIWHGLDIDESERAKDGKDKWIPEPQMGEKRDAKTARGWVWPSDPWHKREGGGASRKNKV
jgi:hypothetical protein